MKEFTRLVKLNENLHEDGKDVIGGRKMEQEGTGGDSAPANIPHQLMSPVPIRLRKGEKLPENAIWLTSEEVVNLHKRKLKNSPNFYNYWALKYGGSLLASASVLSGFTINGMWLDFFGLVGQRFTFSLIPCVLLPAIAVGSFHNLITTDKILSGRMTCPVCTELRASLNLVTSGVVYPTITCPLLIVVGNKKFRSVNVIEHMKKLKTNTYFKKQYTFFIASLCAFAGLICERSIAQFDDLLKPN